MAKQLINPPGTERVSASLQFSQAVRIGETIYVSGQVGYGASGIPDGKEDQCRLAFSNLKTVLEYAGATMADIVSLTSYHTDPLDFDGFKAAQREFIPDKFPAHTAVGVTSLLLPALKCELAAIAVIGGSNPPISAAR